MCIVNMAVNIGISLTFIPSCCTLPFQSQKRWSTQQRVQSATSLSLSQSAVHRRSHDYKEMTSEGIYSEKIIPFRHRPAEGLNVRNFILGHSTQSFQQKKDGFNIVLWI